MSDPAAPTARARHGPRPWLAPLRAASVASVALGAACAILRFDRGDLSIPFRYATGDVLIQATWAKTLIEQGWIHRNPALGAPFGQEYYDFPLSESTNFLLQKLLGWIGGNYGFAVNAYYILTFPLTAACSYGALAALGVSPLPSAIVSVAYALLPYRLYHGEEHLFLSGYHFVPLSALVALWLARSDFANPPVWSRRLLMSAVVMLLMCGSGIYYGFFTAYFLLVGALYAVVRRRSWRTPLVAGGLLAVLLAGGLLNVAPSLDYWRKNGSTLVVRRSTGESVFYGFRIASALMPIPHHRVGALRRVRSSFRTEMRPVLNHDDSASSFGFVASAGFLLLLVVPLMPAVPTAFREVLLASSCLTYAGVLLATTGGFGQLFAYFVTPDIRCWERIVPFLAFFALAAVAIAMDVLGRMTSTLAWRVAYGVGAVGLGVLAVLDQTSPQLVPHYDKAMGEARSDRDFFGGIERALPAGAMLFQVPYVPFPEGPPQNQLRDYDLFRPYLNTTALRWSYGAVRTRFGDAWNKSIARQPIRELVDGLALAGFRGLVVDRKGYLDEGAELDAALRPVIGPPASQSRNGRYTWYRLEAYAAKMRASIGEAEWVRRADRLMKPFYLEWQRGFYALEGEPGASHRWSEAESTLAIDNPRPEPTRVHLTARVCTLWPTPAAFTIRSTELDYATQVGARCADVDIGTTLAPGRTRFRFSTGAAPAKVPGDDRRLFFVLRDFRLVVEGGGVDVLENM